MTVAIRENCVSIIFDPGKNNVVLPNGYSFEPILVTGDDGNEYNVIPSDRFK